MTPLTQRFALTGDRASLNISIPVGTVRLTESNDDSVVVELEGKGADQVEVTAVGDDITISLKDAWDRRFFGFGGSVIVRVQLPTGSNLRTSIASADLFCDVDLGGVKCATASGDLRLANVRESLEVKSASGDVQVGDVGGSLKATLASGDIRAGTIGGTLQVSTASGDIRVEEACGDVRTKSASGNVSIGCWSGREFEAKTVSGDVRTSVPPGTRAELNLKSMSGDIRMPDRQSTAEGIERVARRLSFTSVSGDFQLSLAAE